MWVNVDVNVWGIKRRKTGYGIRYRILGTFAIFDVKVEVKKSQSASRQPVARAHQVEHPFQGRMVSLYREMFAFEVRPQYLDSRYDLQAFPRSI